MQIVPLTAKSGRGKFTVVDDEDAAYLVEIRAKLTYLLRSPPQRHSNLGSRTGYAILKGEFLHRILMQHAGVDLTDLVIDHHNGWGLDNRRINMRPTTPEGNSRNRRLRSIHKTRKGFEVRFGEIIHGYYDTLDLAEAAHEEAAPGFGYVTLKMRERLMEPVVEFIESKVSEGLLRSYIRNAPLIEDRYRIVENRWDKNGVLKV